MRSLLPAILSLLALASPALAQNSAPADFSGTWVLNTSKSTLAKDSKIKAETLWVENKKGAIVFHFKTDGKKSTQSYTPDGVSRKTQDLPGVLVVSKAMWQGSTLVIVSVLRFKIPNGVTSYPGMRPIVDKWSLARDGQTLSWDANNDGEFRVYDKQ